MDKPIYRMSSAGRCPRALSAIRQNYWSEPAPVWLATAAEEGKWHEERIVKELEAGSIDVPGYGKIPWAITSRQREFEIECPSFILRGHIDGRADPSNSPLGVDVKLLEIKSMSQFEFDRWMKEGFRGFPEYADQITSYMEVEGSNETLYIVKNRSSGYKNVGVLTKQPGSISAIISKLTAIEDYLARWVDPGARDGTYPAEFNPNSIECRRCEFKYLCAPEPKELTPIEEAGLISASEDWRVGKALTAQGRELMDRAKEVFGEHTKATGIDRWRFAELAINLVKVKETLAYPKRKLLEVFTEEELAPASEIKLPYEYIKVEDLRKEETQSA